MIGVQRLLAEFRSRGASADGPFESSGLEWIIFNEYNILGGRFDGKTVRIAVPTPADFPATPPGGFYVSPRIVPLELMSGLRVHDPGQATVSLPGEWQYWSRPIPPGTWNPSNGAKRLLAHWNAVMLNAN